jgi:hypothetical protein
LGGTENEFWLFSAEISEADVRLDANKTHFLLLMGDQIELH